MTLLEKAAQAGFDAMIAQAVSRGELESPLLWHSEHVSELCRQDWQVAAQAILSAYVPGEEAGNKP